MNVEFDLAYYEPGSAARVWVADQIAAYWGYELQSTDSGKIMVGGWPDAPAPLDPVKDRDVFADLLKMDIERQRGD